MTFWSSIGCISGFALLLSPPWTSLAQVQKMVALSGFEPSDGGIAIHRRVSAGQPFTVAGSRGVVLGQQEGSFEAWILPIKLLSHFTIRAEVDGYSVPIELNPDAAQIDVFADHTTITYSHIALTVRQTMFSPEETPEGTGAVVVFEVDSTRAVNLTFSFTPEMRPMWPEPSEGNASPEWVSDAGAYILHTDFPNLAGAVAIPTALPGILAPYQEKPQVHALEFKLRYEPARDQGKSYPLLMAVGGTVETATNKALLSRLAELNSSLLRVYKAHAERLASMQENLTSIRTPDIRFDDDFRWAEISIEQLRARSQPAGETGLVAGYYSSGDSARPGFGWYFGRDTLYTLYAVNGMGDFALSRESLEFLIRRQREDGKMMHEYSQTAALIDWKSLPYMYASADATPLFLTALLDYVQTSGDIAFLKKHRDAVEKAWRFESTHDSDGDGVFDNAQGTGWVESWPGGQPNQEIYLALLDQQGSAAMAALSRLLGDPATSRLAEDRATKLAITIEAEYYQPATHDYAFSRNADGSLDRAATIYPSLAWWNGGAGLKDAAASFRRWDSHDFSTDWGVRDVAESDPIYDPISYHQGSVWPLFTGWASIADYRTGRSLSGYAHLRQNSDQTTTQDLGAVTELLSGTFFQPFGRSTSHQLWSSAMVITPTLRGLFGLTIDAASRTVTVAPHLPADWPSAQVRNLHVGDSVCTLSFVRERERLNVRVVTTSGTSVALRNGFQNDQKRDVSLSLPLPAVEVSIAQNLPLPGSRTSQVKVLSERYEARSLTLEFEGQSGTQFSLGVRANIASIPLKAKGALLGEVREDGLRTGVVTFAPGAAYTNTTVVLSW